MLEQLFGSQTRVKLLHIFLDNSEKKYFVRELTRLVGAQINAVRRELENMEKMGLIKKIAQTKDDPKNSKMKYYQVSTDFLFYPELKNLIRKDQFTVEQQFAADLQELGKIQFLALTGKFVGLEHIRTDVLIVGDVKPEKVKKLLVSYEKKFNNEVNYTVMTTDEFNYRRGVADRFLYSILDNKKVVMIDTLVNTSKMIL